MADKAKKADRLENKSHKKTMTTSFGRFKDDLDKKGICVDKKRNHRVMCGETFLLQWADRYQ